MLPVKLEPSATDAIPDLLVVKILNEHYRYDSFEYIIYSDNNAVIRKGTFRAPSVQLRTIGLNEGVYHMDLLYRGQKWKTNHFEKLKNAQQEKRKANTIYFT